MLYFDSLDYIDLFLLGLICGVFLALLCNKLNNKLQERLVFMDKEIKKPKDEENKEKYQIIVEDGTLSSLGYSNPVEVEVEKPNK